VWDTLEDEEDRKLLEMVEKMLPAWTAGNCRKLVKTAKALLD
jgi:hypothetical protein